MLFWYADFLFVSALYADELQFRVKICLSKNGFLNWKQFDHSSTSFVWPVLVLAAYQKNCGQRFVEITTKNRV